MHPIRPSGNVSMQKSVKADEARPLPHANSVMRFPASSEPLASRRDARLAYGEAAPDQYIQVTGKEMSACRHMRGL